MGGDEVGPPWQRNAIVTCLCSGGVSVLCVSCVSPVCGCPSEGGEWNKMYIYVVVCVRLLLFGDVVDTNESLIIIIIIRGQRH